ncbi:MAG: Fe-S cluster assembly protein SufD [Cyanobacteria bacterium J06598_3]
MASSSTASDSTAATQKENQRATYLKHLLTQASAAADESGLGLKPLRDSAVSLVNERAFPKSRDEEWRFTDLSGMLETPFQRAAIDDSADSGADATSAVGEQLARLALNNFALVEGGYRLVTVNGHYATPLSIAGRADAAPKLPEGAVIAPLSELIGHPTYGDRISKVITEKLAQVQGASEVFTALNTAGFSDVMVVWIRADQAIDAPIHIARGSQGDRISHLRTLVIAEAHAKCTVVESFWGDSEQARCNTSVSEFLLSEGAQVDHVRLQDEGAKTFHIAKTAVSQAANSRYRCTSVDLGSQLSRHHHEIYQTGAQTDTHLYGLSALGNQQLADTHSFVALTYPHSTATQIQKNVVDDSARSVFNGKVYVSQAAQFTDASQLNRNLMLSSKARIDTKPELDIVADNVKCAHGATVSQLQADEVFYLQSRGISAPQAQRLLLYGFAMEIIEKISIDSLRGSLSERMTRWAK